MLNISDKFEELFDFDDEINIDNNFDMDNTIEIGDIITIIDYSALSDENGIEIDNELIDLNDEFIVIKTNQNFKFNSIVNYTQDLVVVNRRTNNKYRIPYYFTKQK